ncbi:MAG: hypothetical protein CBC71_06330 [Rhodobacteraceae bacterium TMED111]|nr:hypothetical protein [Marinovum sp.]OUV41115.1 MAG: hypothetical protein CBC71_06330 [Rhodobacteraceae bacterium TMED111]|tara:strand:+ start:6174 stop:6815 length:642 start_codon:yes stop_codon:yes gene_type:complete
MAINPPPIQENTTEQSGKFPQTWVRWFVSIKDCIDELISSISTIKTDISNIITRYGEYGWAYYQDDQYTEGSPLSVDNARVQVTINGNGGSTETRFLPDFGDLWDTANNKINMETVGDAFLIRFDYKGKAATNNAYFDVQLDIGDGSPIVISQETKRFLKGTNKEQIFSDTISGFALETFISNGCKIYIDSTDDGADLEFYDFGIKIERTYTQ